MTSIPALLLRRTPGPLRDVEEGRSAPAEAQRRTLRRLLRQAANTEWGRRYGFGTLAEAPDVVKTYQEHVPLHRYEDIREDAERVRAGAKDVLWPGQMQHFAVSSGTASSGKVLPLSSEMIRCNRRFSLAVGFSYLAETNNWSFLGGRHLTIPGLVEADEERPEALVGEVSGLLAANAPQFFSSLLQAAPIELAFKPDWQTKLKAIADHTLEMDIRACVMVPSWATVFFKLLIERYNEVYGRAATSVADIWPDLQLFISGGVALSSYRELLEEQIDRPVDFIETYGASEGFFSFQDKLEDESMLLHVNNGIFYEFVRLDELNNEAPTRYTIETVEPDVRYAMFISSCSGLWAYLVGDVIRFTETSPPKLLVAGRTNEMIDRYGEAVFGEEARAALQYACDETGAHFADFHIAPRLARSNHPPAHQWLVEFKNAPGDIEAFARLIDEYLVRVNRHYRSRREFGGFAPPEIVPLPEDTFLNWLRATRETITSQTKVPRMSEERTTADSILALAGNNA